MTDKPLTRKEACEDYRDRWQREHLTEAQWDDVLDRLYDGKGATDIVRAMALNETCRRSLQAHSKDHRGFIAFMRGVRLKDRRMQMGGALTDAWKAMLDRLYAIALDESTKPGVAIKAVAVAQREMADLQKLAAATIQEFEKSEEGGLDAKDLSEAVKQIAADVFGIGRGDLGE